MPRPADPNVRTKLLRAAEEVFGAVGVERAHVEAIAAAAGISKGAFYNHFASKDEAFLELATALTGRLRALIANRDLPRDLASAGEFEACCLAFDVRIFEFIWENRRLMRLLLEGGRSHAFIHLLDAFAEQARMLVVEHLELGKQRGVFRADLDVDVASTLISGGYDRFARTLVRMPERPNLEALLTTLQRVVLFGIASSLEPSGVAS